MKPIDALKVQCRANGCTARVPAALLMCAPHWRMVPPGLQAAVWAAFVPEQVSGQVEPSDAWYAAAAAAVEAVARLEGRDEANVFRAILESRRDG